ncbi:MAG: hypothetical protein NC115_04380 [Bacteroidales bacterium]|nr:hypothetical protein [Bacteroidales bacterium]
MHVRVFAFLMVIPVLGYGCTSVGTHGDVHTGLTEESTGTEIVLNTGSSSDDGTTDIFIFMNDRLRRLDSYQRVTGRHVKVASRAGERIMVAISNPHRERDSWRWISSYEALQKESMQLSSDSPDCPAMAGEAIIQAGSGIAYAIQMDRLMSQICINSLRADFLGTEYEGEDLTDTRIYLTNVNAEYSFMQTGPSNPGQIVNFGSLDEEATGNFAHSEMLIQEIGKVSAKGIPDPIRLFCYPCDHSAETSGSPFTRLVIEGRIRGKLYYYPITINREPFGAGGIERNSIYMYDITINRSGTPDPDIPADSRQVTVIGEIAPWNEQDNEIIVFRKHI